MQDNNLYYKKYLKYKNKYLNLQSQIGGVPFYTRLGNMLFLKPYGTQSLGTHESGSTISQIKRSSLSTSSNELPKPAKLPSPGNFQEKFPISKNIVRTKSNIVTNQCHQPSCGLHTTITLMTRLFKRYFNKVI